MQNKICKYKCMQYVTEYKKMAIFPKGNISNNQKVINKKSLYKNEMALTLIIIIEMIWQEVYSSYQ